LLSANSTRLSGRTAASACVSVDHSILPAKGTLNLLREQDGKLVTVVEALAVTGRLDAYDPFARFSLFLRFSGGELELFQEGEQSEFKVQSFIGNDLGAEHLDIRTATTP
jgi:hypothetical protein